MALEPVSGTPGLWRVPDWAPDTPGLYALIVGISNYPHLMGGSAPANNTYNLGQLEVSARTAAAVFHWLCLSYKHEALPVVWCFLLLSPTAAEMPFLNDKMITHYENPTDGGLRNAISLWYGSLPTQGAPSEKSRTLFFFSGHGLQSNWDPLLLPSDYLAPPNLRPILRNCLSAKEMTEWMKTHPVAEHLAVFDACRNEFSPLASVGSTANSIFPVNPPGRPPKVVACLHATAPSSTAYQTSNEEFSFFGKAFIEGVQRAGGQGNVRRPGFLDVEFIDLVRYVKPRVMELLQAHSETLEQTARGAIEPCDASLVVTQLPLPVGTVGAGPSRGRFYVGGPHERTAAQRGPSKVQLREQAETIQESYFNVSMRVTEPLSSLRDFSTAHRYFGHEFATRIWHDFRMYALSDRVALADDHMSLHHVTRDAASTIVRVDMELSPRRGGILAAFERTPRGMQALPLPTDEHGFVPIRLTLAFRQGTLQRVEGRLGPSAQPNHHYDYLWTLSRIAKFASFIDAAKEADPRRLQQTVEYKREAPTAAMAGAIILARGGKILTVGDWTRNLMNWFADVPDGSVLWAESLKASMLDGQTKPFGLSDPLGAMADALGELLHRGVPFFVEGLELLDSQLRYLEGRRGDLSDSQAGTLGKVRQMGNRVLQIGSPGGHFMMFAGLPRPAGFGNPDRPIAADELLDLLRPKKKKDEDTGLPPGGLTQPGGLRYRTC